MKNKEFGSIGGNIKHPNKAVREFYEPLSNLELAVNLLTVLSVPVAVLGARSFSTIKNKIQKMTSRRIIEKLGEKQIKVDGYTKTQLEKLLSDLQDSLDRDDGESAKEIALTIRQIAKDRPAAESKKTPSTMPKQRDPNWRTMQAKATSGAGGRHRDEKRAVKQGDVKHKKDLIPIESIEEDAFYNMVDWYKSAGPEQRESVDKHPAFQDHPEQLEKLKSAANIQEDDGVAASPQLQRAHQRERERRGLPHPDEYLRMIEKKKKEIAAMRAQDLEKDVKEAQDPDEGYMDRVISDLHKDARGVRPDQEWGNWWMSLSYDEKLKIFNDMVDELGESVKEASDWGEPGELLTDVLTALERQVEWPLTDVMDRREVQSLLQPVRDAINAKMKNIGPGVQEGSGDTHLKRLEYDVRQLIDMGDYDAAKEHAALAPTADLRTHLRKIIRKAMVSPKSNNLSVLKKNTKPSGLSVKQYVAQQMEDEYGDGDITFHRDYAGGYNVRHTDDAGEIHSHQYDPRTGKVNLRNIVGSTEESVGEGTDFFDRFGLPIMPDDDGKFRDMMRGIKRGTKKQARADRQERDAQSRERARAAFGPSPADKLSIRRDQGVAEGNDDWGSMSHGEFKRRELQHELGHETNNVSIDINGKPWKVLKGESENPRRALARAEKIAATIKRNALAKGRKEPKVDVYVTGAPATE